MSKYLEISKIPGRKKTALLLGDTESNCSTVVAWFNGERALEMFTEAIKNGVQPLAEKEENGEVKA